MGTWGWGLKEGGKRKKRGEMEGWKYFEEMGKSRRRKDRLDGGGLWGYMKGMGGGERVGLWIGNILKNVIKTTFYLKCQFGCNFRK